MGAADAHLPLWFAQLHADEPGAEPRRIGVFRALVLGDLLCAVPALRALKRCFPKADVGLIGLPWAREFAARLPHVDHFIEFPGYPGLPERTPQFDAIPGFLQTLQAARYDLLLQLHGNGSIVNPLLAACGARHLAGFVEPGGFCAEPALHCPWPTEGSEVERLLRLMDHLGVPRQGTDLEFPLTEADRRELAALWPGAFSGTRYVCVHAGAQLASRQWPAARFAAVANVLADQGHTIVLTGTAAETQCVGEVAAALRHDPVNLVGRTGLWTLGALIERASLLVSNDTGVSHIAAALGTRSVVVSCGADVSRWAPADATRHRVLWAAMPCRPCAHRVCPYDHGCATRVGVEAVAQAALAALGS